MPRDGAKGKHQFKRRFSLQPSSFFRDDSLSSSHSIASGSVEGGHHHHDQLQPPSSSSDPADVTRHKIVVMGAARVGKSSLITQFLYRKFSSKYKRTVEEMHHGQFTVDGVKIDLDILDTSGAYEFPAMRALSISSADAFVLVYSVTDPDSFQQAAAIRDQIIETKHTADVPIVVVGNKLDLANSDRKVSYEETSCLVEVDWENGFVETSAKDNINVGEVFKELLNQAKIKYDLGPSLRRNSARRQSLPSGGGSGQGSMVPTPAQLAHLQKKASGKDDSGGGGGGGGGGGRSKRNSCSIS
ncbi:ras-related protein Rap-2b-like [Acyrthosiphon pisum]|uniref:GTP-binding protein Rhes n=1 Tax=Acyrthosiphon pisum TaxID=7029 RepID=A0A8R1ZZV6_ACYPI|nr:ras-related protein Rap-2b-like [Acyrthosiphon pisum]XP_016657430.1 ras-related protein Rap-2b-like [Acyrthosiphon pisum]|eukprot:XP_001943267.2 PREDICTED: ras-related protein Rap-2b-like [Acyrthosiphon pisum]